MSTILVDGITNLSVHNGMLRIECMAIGADGQPHSSGVLLIPGMVAGPVVNSLVQGMQDLDKKVREQAPTAGNA